MTDPYADAPEKADQLTGVVPVCTEDTMSKVNAALHAAGLTDRQATDAILEMQNEGILFREQGSTGDPGAMFRGRPEQLTDGYHTMQELYGHRRALTAVLATIAAINGDSWRSKQHHPDDDPIFDGYFIVGIELPAGPISYHYPLAVWDDFAAVPELEHAPKWDGHTGDEVIYRLMDFSGVLRAAMDEVTAAAQVAEKAEKGTDG